MEPGLYHVHTSTVAFLPYLQTHMASLASYSTLFSRGRSEIPEYSARTSLSALSHLSDTRNHVSPDILQTLNDLVKILKDNDVEGPQLFRVKTEFNNSLGSGAQCSVWGIGERQLKEILRLKENCRGNAKKIHWPSHRIAIKRHIPVRSRDSLVENVSTQRPDTLGHHLWAAKQEIEALSFPPLRRHKNIVKLLGWGFCLDVAESSQLQIPLLVLERADMNLFEILQMQRDATIALEYCLDERDLCRLLKDVGRGMSALHEAGLSHGDLKPQNILVFKSGSGNVTWTAKLCDFGFARGDIKEGAEFAYRYYGTPGWIPPEANLQDDFPLESGALKKCDVYVYGLLVCSVFTKYGAPLQSLTARHSTFDLTRALSNIGKRVFPCGWERYKLAATEALKLSLQANPQSRSSTPWGAWDSGLNLDIPPFVYKSFSTLMAALRLATHLSRHKAFAKTFLPARSLIPHRRKSHPPLQRSDKQQKYPEVWEKFHGTQIDTVSEDPLDGDKDPFDLSKFTHGDRCVDLSGVKERLWKLIFRNREKEQIEIYSLARLRSRLRLCCWKRGIVAMNMLQCALAAAPAMALSILAWLVRGEVGLYEIKRLAPVHMVWIYIIQPTLMDESQRLERFLLLFQFGAEVEKHLQNWSYPSRSILVDFIQACRPAITRTILDEIQRRFSDSEENGYMSQTTKDYFRKAPTKHARTALSHFARNLMQVRLDHLLRHGCSPKDEFILRDKAASSFRLNLRLMENLQQLEKITRFLRHWGRPMRRRHSAPEDKSRESESPIMLPLPPGWEEIIVRDQQSQLEIGRCYQEEHTKSLTLRRPTFSLYVVRHLVLGVEGATKRVYLALNGFVNLNSVQQAKKDWETIVRQRFSLYDGNWFRMEAYTENPQRDVLSDIKDAWQPPSLPSLLSLPQVFKYPFGAKNRSEYSEALLLLGSQA